MNEPLIQWLMAPEAPEGALTLEGVWGGTSQRERREIRRQVAQLRPAGGEPPSCQRPRLGRRPGRLIACGAELLLEVADHRRPMVQIAVADDIPDVVPRRKDRFATIGGDEDHMPTASVRHQGRLGDGGIVGERGSPGHAHRW